MAEGGERRITNTDRYGLGVALAELSTVFSHVRVSDSGQRVEVRDFDTDVNPRFVIHLDGKKAEIVIGYATTMTVEEAAALQRYAVALTPKSTTAWR